MAEHDLEHVVYDAELRLHDDALRRAYEIGPEDRVLESAAGRDRPRVMRRGSPATVGRSASTSRRR